MFAVLKYNEEIFTNGLAPVSYSWNSSNHNVLAITFPSKPLQSDEPPSTALATSTSQQVYLNKKIRDNLSNNNNAVFLTNFNSTTIYTTGGKQ